MSFLFGVPKYSDKPANPKKLKELNALKLKIEAELEQLQKQKKLLFSQIQANIWLRDNKQ